METPHPTLIDLLDQALCATEDISMQIEVLVAGVAQWRDAAGISTGLLDAVYGQERMNTRNAAAVSSCLIQECGANPLETSTTVNRQIMNVMFSTLRALYLLEEKARGCRTSDGGNVLHHLANSNSVYGMEIVAMGAQADMSHSNWFTHAQHDGKLPLHLLWGRVERENGNEKIWTTTLGHLRRGVSLGAADEAGRTVLDLIHEALNLHSMRLPDGDERQESAMKQVHAYIQGHTLREQSPDTTGRARSVRL